jgi:Domain found in Dishevelled, Egl-10, and Pleckstrin (DEP)
MLILQSDQVQYLEVIQTVGDRTERKPGLSYQNKLFNQGKVFASNQSKEAVQFTRDAFLELKVACLLVEDPESLTFWYEDLTLKAYDSSQDAQDANDIHDIASINLHKLARQMRDVGGIKIQDRWYNFKTYHRCLIGGEAVAWMKNHLKISTDEAIALGQRLIDAQLLHSVLNEQRFQRGHVLYRFNWDD